MIDYFARTAQERGTIPPVSAIFTDYPVYGEVNLSAFLAGGFFASIYGDSAPSIH